MRTLELREVGPTLIPGILGLTRWENNGAMLNILAGQQWLLAGIAFAAAIILIMILLRYNEGFWGTLGLAAVLGGTIGNLVDRIFNDGYVIDMFRTLFINFPIFNIADVFITLGFATFCIHFIALSVKSGKNAEAAIGAVSVDFLGDTEESHISPDIQIDFESEELPDADTIISQQTMSTPERPAEQTTDITAEPVLYEPVSESTPEISFTLEALDALEAEIESVDDIDIDDLLREYGFEDNDVK